MTKAKTLTLLNEYLLNGSGLTLNEMKRSLEQDIRDDNNKLNGSANIGKAMKAILKVQDVREDLTTAFSYGEGQTGVCNGFQILVTHEPIDIEKQDKPPFNLESLLAQYHNTILEDVKTPTIGEVRTEQQLQKANDPKSKVQVFKFERADGKFVAVDCKLLIHMLTADPDADIQVSSRHLNDGVWFNHPNAYTYGILMSYCASK